MTKAKEKNKGMFDMGIYWIVMCVAEGSEREPVCEREGVGGKASRLDIDLTGYDKIYNIF